MPLVSNAARRKSREFTPAPAPYSDDVFNTLLYTGNTGSQQLNAGFTDFNTEGGLFWAKERGATSAHSLADTNRGPGLSLDTSSSNSNASTGGVQQFTPGGVFLGADVPNLAGKNYVSWFMKQAQSFFKIVTWSGNSVSGRVIPHGLNAVVGQVFARIYDQPSNWYVWHRSATGDLFLDQTDGQSASKNTIIEANPTNLVVNSFSVINQNGYNYIAFIFAHDPSPNGIVFCDTYTTDATGVASINTGWPVQYIQYKAADVASDWAIVDAARGPSFSVAANTTAGDVASTVVSFTGTGFNVAHGASFVNKKFIYRAIRARNKASGPNNLVIPGGNSIDVYSLAIANGWDQTSALTVTVTADVGSNSTATAGLVFNGTYPDVTLIINPGIYVCGRGGLGSTSKVAGAPGGPAISTNGPIKISNYGVIGGGGGAGGSYYNGTSYGGNGGGLPVQAPLGTSTTATKTNGGNGQQSTYGAGGVGGAAGSNGATNQGSGGGGGIGGTGGASSTRGSGTTFSDPANSGQGGAGQTDSDPTANAHPSYAGGAAGAYIVGNSKVTWISTGTRYGPIIA